MYCLAHVRPISRSQMSEAKGLRPSTEGSREAERRGRGERKRSRLPCCGVINSFVSKNQLARRTGRGGFNKEFQKTGKSLVSRVSNSPHEDFAGVVGCCRVAQEGVFGRLEERVPPKGFYKRKVGWVRIAWEICCWGAGGSVRANYHNQF
jgi:hypothetical protein